MKNSRYNEILCDHIRNTELRRVRVKTDPNTKNYLSFGHGYEGYILEEEENGVITVMIPDFSSDNNIFKLEPDEYDDLGSNDSCSLEHLKHIALDYMPISDDEEKRIEIANMEDIHTVDDLETYLRAKNVTNDDMVNIFKDFFKL